VVAIGAAIQAAALSSAQKRRGTVPPAPSPASRQTQPKFSDAQLPQAERAAARSRPTGASPGSTPFATSPEIPSTQPFFGRQHVATTPGIAPGSRPAGPTHESTLGALRKSATTAAPSTLGGLGPRQGVKTGRGLGPEAERAQSGRTLVSAADEAQSAHDALSDALGFALETPLNDASSSRREDSLAFVLGDGDFLDVESAPHQSAPSHPSPSSPNAYAAPLTPGLSALDDEAELPLPELPEEEITHVTAPPAPTATAPMRAVTAPMPVTPPPAAFAPFAPLLTTPTPATPAAPAPPSAPQWGLEVESKPRSMPPPLLIDVTPLSLAVETVDGFCDAVIERNMQVPCERTRVFVTAVDGQTVVRVRISQGESSRFAENTLLGEVELSGLRPAPRGETQIAVSFSLDTNGMLNVSAKDVATNRATSIQVRLVALPESSEIARMIKRHAAR
jgi:hypothetical protein